MIETINKIVRTQRLILVSLERSNSRRASKKLRMPLEKKKSTKNFKEPVSLEKPVGDEDNSLGDFIEDTTHLHL